MNVARHHLQCIRTRQHLLRPDCYSFWVSLNAFVHLVDSCQVQAQAAYQSLPLGVLTIQLECRQVQKSPCISERSALAASKPSRRKLDGFFCKADPREDREAQGARLVLLNAAANAGLAGGPAHTAAVGAAGM
eukprot:CAMPEP_0202916658 /NCGR_PEP_ID=MMETSP1392-20130828/69136_1 /ASSEMBLY_ACC=CAM_ASM_000868 /TAXON_ID=225041 /ORGANISM="Chlamydomonas chlamydogama, Strain SAG 11-48b" /LENGTH=132 /DNA_ID=CAMNT_0049609167 /DNA_START=672 /DNA_END=1070 /DNA_ORIENTATION=-